MTVMKMIFEFFLFHLVRDDNTAGALNNSGTTEFTSNVCEIVNDNTAGALNVE